MSRWMTPGSTPSSCAAYAMYAARCRAEYSSIVSMWNAPPFSRIESTFSFNVSGAAFFAKPRTR
jgi:hypothetical protein